MKRLLTIMALMCAAFSSYGATLVPVQLLNPTGSTSGQAIVSTGASTAPAWGSIPNQTGRLIGIQYLTSASGTYTPDAGTNSIVLLIQAPGGGGGGCAATTSGQNAVGGGGASGGLIQKRQTSGFSGSTYVIPAGGAGGPAGANAGSAGGSATWSNGSLTVAGGAGGGGGAVATTAGASAYGVKGATPTTGDLNIPGNTGGVGLIMGVGLTAFGGIGANSIYGGGGQPPFGGTGAGGAGIGYGSGGSGATCTASASAQAGGAGAPGLIEVYEYQ